MVIYEIQVHLYGCQSCSWGFSFLGIQDDVGNSPQEQFAALVCARAAECCHIRGNLSYDQIAAHDSHKPNGDFRSTPISPCTSITVTFFTTLAGTEMIWGTAYQRRHTVFPVERACRDFDLARQRKWHIS